MSLWKRVLFLICIIGTASFPVLSYADPLGYPWTFSGELNSIYGSAYDSRRPKTDVYLEQGIDWFEVRPKLVFNTFIAGKLTTDRDNSKIGPWFGIQFTQTFSAGSTISVGLRGENDNYLYSIDHRHDEIRGILFLKWSFSGDHKKK